MHCVVAYKPEYLFIHSFSFFYCLFIYSNTRDKAKNNEDLRNKKDAVFRMPQQHEAGNDRTVDFLESGQMLSPTDYLRATSFIKFICDI